MDLVDQAALNGLNTSLIELIGIPDLTPMLLSSRYLSVGLGSMVGMSRDPARYDVVRGRRLEAEISVLVSAATPQQTREKVNAVVMALLAADRAQARRLGLLKCELRKRGLPRELDGTPQGSQEIDLRFSVLYEYIHDPTQAAERIEEIKLHLLGPGAPQILPLNPS